MADFELDTEYTFDCRFEVNTVACDWGNIKGDINDQTDLKDALDNKADVETVNGIDERLGTVENTIEGYGNIVTHDVSEFASAEQGALADTSLQPNDNISELVNDAGYITSSALPTVNNSTITIQKNGTKVEDFTLNQSTDKSINITVPTQLSELGTETQMSAINSGMNSTLAGQITTNQNAISLINGKIPSQASSSNQLADKDFVNSSISTNTANFIGTFNSVADLEAYSGTLTNNDYAFVIGTDGDGNTVYNRYKYTTATTPASWVFEYALNNSSFTANQWASINSGANTTNIGQIAINTNAITLINTTIGGYGDIVTHNASEFATAQQGSLADTSLQPNDNISELVNDAGYTSNVGTVISVNNTSPDANGNVSISIPPAQVQADWDEEDTTSKAYIQNKPYIPSGVIIDQVFDGTSENGQSGKAILPVLHSSKGYTESGQVYSDTQLYNDILAQYTNSFDLSKFTVTGTPTITADGIISNITTNDRINASISLSGNTISASCGFYYTIGSANGCPLSLIASGSSVARFYINTSGNIIMTASSANNETISITTSDITLSANDFIIGTMELADNKVFKFTIKNITKNETATVTSTETWTSTVSSIVRVDYGSSLNFLPYSGTIDLKYSSITVDGVEVFSGHKTGTDTYYTDNYTVVGSPTIADGIASGFTLNDYVTTGNAYLENLGSANNWLIELTFTMPASVNSGSYNYLISSNNGTTESFTLQLRGNSKFYTYMRDINGNSLVNNTVVTGAFTLGTEVSLRFGYTGTQYEIHSKTDGGDWVLEWSKVTNTKIFNTNTPLIFGRNISGNSTSQLWYGSINLRSVRVIANGVLIYSGQLSIPYTISDIGSKIADSQYRPDVLGAYVKYGANSGRYYTIDTVNQNATLPCGDVYSLIATSMRNNFKLIQGYDGTATQTLKHVSGVLQWVTDA